MLSKSHTKYITSLHHKKFRDEYGVFFAEGPKVVGELLHEENILVKEIIATKDWIESNATISLNVTLVEVFELAKISAMAVPNQVFGVFEKIKTKEPELKNSVSLVLDCIQDPGNLGTIIRTADWFGINNIICSNDCADMYNPKVVQSTMGSIARVSISYRDLVSFLAITKVKKYAAALNGDSTNKLKGITEGIVIIGNESKGISNDILQLADEKITISKIGKAESLNAGVASGIILSHL